jgi:hypothetical protein
MGPVWDFNLAYGNQYEGGFWSPEGWVRDHWLDPVPFWWDRLLEDPSYAEALNCRWKTLRSELLSLERVYGLIDAYAEEMGPAVERNFERWDILGEEIWPNYFVEDTYDEELDRLKWWIAERVDWLDRNMPGTCRSLGEEVLMKELNVNIFPNPSSGRFVVEIGGGNSESKTIEIMDMHGRVMNSRYLPPGYGSLEEFDLSDATPGLYLIRVQEGQECLSSKILIN